MRKRDLNIAVTKMLMLVEKHGREFPFETKLSFFQRNSPSKLGWVAVAQRRR